MSNLNNFTSKENLKMLWEILLDELNINSNNIKLISNIQTIFDSNINLFLIRANKTLPIMSLNKQFLGQVVLAVNQLIPNLKQNQFIKKITITDEEIIEPYKIEDIHASRQNNFELEVQKKKIELENFLIPPKPPALNFADNNENNPLTLKITEIGPLLAEKIAERNFDLDQIQNTNFNKSSLNQETWLKPQETSIKNDFNNINNIITPKKVTFSTLNGSQEPSNNIFQKLKKNSSEENNDSNEKYIEQKSMLLPEVITEKNARNLLPINNNLVSPLSNISIIPNQELAKQINEMAIKMDNLYEMVRNLSNLVKSNLVKDEEKNDRLNEELNHELNKE